MGTPTAGIDPEASAISTIVEALSPLDTDAQHRVLRYVADRAKLTLESTKALQVEHQGTRAQRPSNSPPFEFEHIADLFSHANPDTDGDRALLASYWFQVCKGEASFGGQQLNDALKDLGYPAANITKTLSRLMDRKPNFIQQIEKMGKSRQARKLYKVTQAGIAAAEAMLQKSSPG